MEAPRYLALGQHLASDVTSIVTANVTTGQQAAQVINSHFYVCSDSERINNIDVFTAPTLPSMAISQVNANGWSKLLTSSD